MFTHARIITLGVLAALSCGNIYAASYEEKENEALFYRYVDYNGFARKPLTAYFIFPSKTFCESKTPIEPGQRVPQDTLAILITKKSIAGGYSPTVRINCPFDFYKNNR